MVSPAKFEARKSLLFTESSLVLKIKNTWLLIRQTFIVHIVLEVFN